MFTNNQLAAMFSLQLSSGKQLTFATEKRKIKDKPKQGEDTPEAREKRIRYYAELVAKGEPTPEFQF